MVGLVVIAALFVAFPTGLLVSELLGISEFVCWVAASVIAAGMVLRSRRPLRSPTTAFAASLGLIGAGAIAWMLVLTTLKSD